MFYVVLLTKVKLLIVSITGGYLVNFCKMESIVKLFVY